MPDLNTVANFIAVTALLPIGLFIYFYGTTPTTKWYKRKYSRLWKTTTVGKVLMSQKIVWFIFLLFVLHGIFFDYPAKDVIRMVVYSALVVQFWVVFVVLRILQTATPRQYIGQVSENPLPEEDTAH